VRALEVAGLVSDRLPRGSDGKYAAYLDQKEGYDRAGDLGRGLRTVARLIRLDVGLIAASVDVGGWDTHENQQGRFQNNVNGFPADLARSGTTSPPTTTGSSRRLQRVRTSPQSEQERRHLSWARRGDDHHGRRRQGGPHFGAVARP
jgi:hypothetical protein